MHVTSLPAEVWMLVATIVAGMVITMLKAIADCLSYETRLREVHVEAERIRRAMAERLRGEAEEDAEPVISNEFVQEIEVPVAESVRKVKAASAAAAG